MAYENPSGSKVLRELSGDSSRDATAGESSNRTRSAVNLLHCNAIGDFSDRNRAPQQRRPFEVGQPFALREAGDSDHRNGNLEQLSHIVASCAAELDDDDIGKTHAELCHGVGDAEVTDGVETAFNQLCAET